MRVGDNQNAPGSGDAFAEQCPGVSEKAAADVFETADDFEAESVQQDEGSNRGTSGKKILGQLLAQDAAQLAGQPLSRSSSKSAGGASDLTPRIRACLFEGRGQGNLMQGRTRVPYSPPCARPGGT